MRKFSTLLGLMAIVMTLALTPFTSHAAEFLAPGADDTGSITLPSSQTHHNLYLAGGNVTVDSVTSGDLYVAGGTIIVSGDVEQDANVAGGTVVLGGRTGGDLRVFGGNVTLNSPVGGDVLVFGGTVTLAEQAAVGGDLIVGSGTVTVNGRVGGSVWAHGGNITLNSEVTGSVKVRSSDSLVFGPNARISGTVSYRGPTEAVIQDGAQVSSIDYQRVEQRRGSGRHFAGLLTLGFLLKLLAWIAAALVLLQLFRKTAYMVSESIRQSPWVNLGIGFLSLIVVPIVSIVLLVVVLGYYLAILLLLAYAFFLAVSCLTAAVTSGAVIIKWLTKKPELVLDWQAVVIGVVVFSIIALVPVVGWLIISLLTLMAFGAYVRMVRAVTRVSNN